MAFRIVLSRDFGDEPALATTMRWSKQAVLERLRSRDADGVPGRTLPVLLFSNEGFEPPHIHVEGASGYAKLWLEPVRFAEARRLNGKEMRDIRRTVQLRRNEILEAWNEHFGHQD